MAQRTVHYLFGEMISDHIALSDKKRFLLGSILPDAIAPSDRNTSHFKVETPVHKYFDFEAFRAKYADRILQDDLYLGYYMHLVEDAFYRSFFYSGGFSMPRTREEVPLLHRDYHLLNAYIVGKYQLRNLLGMSYSLSGTARSRLVNFRTDTFLKEFSQDFQEQPQGTATFLTEAMVEQFIARFVPPAVEEAKRVINGDSVLKATDFAWPAKR